MFISRKAAVWWDNEAAIRWESEYAAKHAELPARVYFYVGAFEDEIHQSVSLGSLEHALRSLYARRSVSLPVGSLRRYKAVIAEYRIVPVAVLSSSTFDATTALDPASLNFGLPKLVRLSGVRNWCLDCMMYEGQATAVAVGAPKQ